MKSKRIFQNRNDLVTNPPETMNRETEDQNTPPSNVSEHTDGEPETRSHPGSQTAEVDVPPNPEHVPLPTDDELLCEAFTIQEEQCRQLSFDLTDQETS